MSGDDGDQPPQKRSRVSRACDQCRNGRERCNGAQPCHTCNIQTRQCSYNEQPKKRGIQPNYIRTLELTLAWLFHTFPEVETQLATVLCDHTTEVPRLITGKDSNRTEALHQVWRNGIISRQIDQVLSGGRIEAPKAAAIVDDGVSREAVSVAAKHGLLSPLFGQPVPSSLLDSPAGSNTQVKMAASQSKLELPHDAWTLIEYYWAFTHSWLPIAEKATVLKVLYAYPSDGVSLETASSAEHVELWSIMALAAFQLANIGRREDGEIIRNTARNLLPQSYDRAGLGHVKALLLLALVDITNEQWLPAWILVGSAIRLLFFDRGSCKAGQYVTNERLDHVYLAAFVLESSIAGVLHSSTHMRIENINTIGFISEEGLEEWSPWLNPLSDTAAMHGKAPARSCSTFNNVVRLTLHYLETQPRQSTPNKQYDRPAGHHAATGRQISQMPTGVEPALSAIPSTKQNIVLILSQNASDTTTSAQQHPSTLISSRMSSLYHIHDLPAALPTPIFPSPLSHGQPQRQLPPTSQSPYGAESNEFRNVNVAPSLWLQGTSDDLPVSNSRNDDVNGLAVSADIFEEFAMLEGKDTNQHAPQFMQNLGFAPDLDLAEFFGPDYLPSDPMLAYLQPGVPDTNSSNQGQDGG
nr:quinic acid utilization activator [Quercus suber]